jgi:hypothetical protein
MNKDKINSRVPRRVKISSQWAAIGAGLGAFVGARTAALGGALGAYIGARLGDHRAEESE